MLCIAISFWYFQAEKRGLVMVNFFSYFLTCSNHSTLNDVVSKYPKEQGHTVHWGDIWLRICTESLELVPKSFWKICRFFIFPIVITFVRALRNITPETELNNTPPRQVWSALLGNIEWSSETGDNEICHGPRDAGTKRFVYFLCLLDVLPLLPWSFLSDHINHIRSVAGVDSVGIGASYDGINEWVRKLVKLRDLSGLKHPLGWVSEEV